MAADRDTTGWSEQHRSLRWPTRTSALGPAIRTTLFAGSPARHPVTSSTSAPGTGKLTRSLVALGHRVTAVEPLPEMLAQLRAAVPEAEAVIGSAESMPLPDGSADVVTCAQAFHWFDHGPALAQIARVLRPGGRLALVWNTRDERVAWVEEFTELMVGRSRMGRRYPDVIDESGLYGPVEHEDFDHAQELDREALRELVLSRSDCAMLAPEEREPVLRHVDGIFERHASGDMLRAPVRDRLLSRDQALTGRSRCYGAPQACLDTRTGVR